MTSPYAEPESVTTAAEGPPGSVIPASEGVPGLVIPAAARAAPAAPSAASSVPASSVPAGPPPSVRVAPAGEPVLPEQSREDTDAAWGEYPESAQERLYRDRPPHWDDF